jgi:cellulose synthase/poly-beta-1,6-N-acetylglucosamine synthase-like glycosyltransferase
MTPIQMVLAACFWGCLAGVAYTYLGYPVLIGLLARWFGRRPQAAEAPAEELPSLTLLIAAYNEESVIDERLRNALAMDYPAGKLEVVVASDGSADGTNAIVQRYADRGVRLLDFPMRRGKAAALNAAFTELKGDVVMLSDANTFADPSAAHKLARWFRDPGVGVVCGRLVLTDPLAGTNADSLYWRYENFLKQCEGRLGVLLGANGGIYAIRRELYVPIPVETIVDDFVIPLRAKLRTGCAILYDSEAVAHEETPADVRAEFRRRARIGAGGFQSLRWLWRLLDPRRGLISLAFFSHKVLRWLGPFLLLGMLAANAALLDQRPYQVLMAGQVGFYLLAAAAAYLPPGRFKLLKPLRLTTMFTSMNLALLMGCWRWLRGTQKGTWKRTERVVEAKEADLQRSTPVNAAGNRVTR